MREVLSEAARSLCVVHRIGKLFACPRLLISCFNAYILSTLECFVSVWVSSAESHLGLLDSIFRSAEKLCEGKLCCLGHERKVSAFCLLYKIYDRVGHPMTEYLNHFFATLNTGASAAPWELALMIPRCRTDKFSLLLLPAAVHLSNLMPPFVFSGGALSSLRAL